MNLNVTNLIRKKRDKKALSKEEISALISAYSQDKVPDYQMSAFLMAGYLNGFTVEESAALTYSMLHSGDVLEWSQIPARKVDKHSTGGVGDKTSLILAPIVAAAGVAVPMISGRGLGHTGGTLDKLESISGFRSNLSVQEFGETLAKTGCSLIGQTSQIAPADKRLYALRDVTATVECIPLIAGSIMSKKLAEGIDGLVLDVKFGNGAFMKTREQAMELASTLVGIAHDFGKDVVALLTRMEEPLGWAVGNFLEVIECVDCMRGKETPDLMELTHALAGTMIFLGKKADSIEHGIDISKELTRNGKAFDKFCEIIAAQDGDISVLENRSLGRESENVFEIKATSSGFISSIDAFDIGLAAIELGAGRHVKEDVIEPLAGFVVHKKVGDYVKDGETILTAYTNKADVERTVKEMLGETIEISKNEKNPISLIEGYLYPDGNFVH